MVTHRSQCFIDWAVSLTATSPTTSGRAPLSSPLVNIFILRPHATEGFQAAACAARECLASRIVWFPSARNTSHWRKRHGLPHNADRPQILLSSLILLVLARRFGSRFSLRVKFSDNGTLERSFSTSSQKHCERRIYRGRVSAIHHELGMVKAYPSQTAFGDIKGTPSRENVSPRRPLRELHQGGSRAAKRDNKFSPSDTDCHATLPRGSCN
jgi:hypothetical protein